MQLFRTQALEHQNRLHGEVFLVPPLRWQAIGWLLFIAVAAALLVLTLGTHSQSVEARGVLVQSDGAVPQSPRKLIVILAVAPSQIATIGVGQSASISLNRYPARAFGVLTGKVAYVATNPSNEADLRFKVIVALDPLSDQQRKNGLMLRNNWPVSGRIIIQKQSILAWLTLPKSAGYGR